MKPNAPLLEFTVSVFYDEDTQLYRWRLLGDKNWRSEAATRAELADQIADAIPEMVYEKVSA